MSEYNYTLVVQFEKGGGKQDYSIWNDFSKDRLVPYLNENYPGWVSARLTIFRFYALVMPTKTDIIEEARNQEWREINGEWYCPICVERLFNYDEDNDVYTRKESI